MTQSKRKLIWAIDPFETKNETRSHLLATLRELASLGAQIEPVYVLSPDEYDVNLEFNSPWLKQIRPTAEKVIDQYLKDIKLDGLGKPQVLIEKRPSLTRAVKALVAHAKSVKADTILVGTHAKEGMSRFFLGSFAETLLLHSAIPVLVVGPHTKVTGPSKKTSRILFPTDFGPTSNSTFKKVLALAKTHNAEITLFHCLPHPVEPYLRSGVYLLSGTYMPFPDYATQDEKRKQKTAQKYVAQAKRQGIKIEVCFNPGHEATARAIVEQTLKENSDLIAIAAQSGPVAAALIGSVARQVVRTAPCPVWVVRAR